MKLYGTRTSPFVRKARIALIESRLPFEFDALDIWKEAGRIIPMNPLGKVPVLVLADGSPVFDSFAIIDYVDRASGAGLIPQDDSDRRTAFWWYSIAQGIIDASVVEVLERRRPPELQSAAQIERERTRIARALDTLEARMSGTGPVLRSGFTFADITLSVALLYMDFRTGVPWRNGRPALNRWMDVMSKRPSIVETAPPAS